MDADPDGYVLLFALEVADDASYARYREAMTPILESYGGRFGVDFVVSRVLRGPERVNRVFSMRFPDRGSQERFFADAAYRAVRSAHFEPAVVAVHPLGRIVPEAGQR
jgi:uncharacterized protein (DUF1330 family)